MSARKDLYPGFAQHWIDTGRVTIYARVGGTGLPLLLLHGYPQTHVCWHKIAPELARRFTLVIPDLRGYGASSAPLGDAQHEVYSKRAMAEDCIALMRALGHVQFTAVGHDRGARVAYRLALDHPEVLERLVILDILPTAEVWARMTWQSAIKSYHWSFLAQPAPIPETLIAAAPAVYVEHTLKSWTRAKSHDCFAPEALAHYRTMLDRPERIHAVCEDYRAGATCDREADEADRRAKRKIVCPTLVLWSSDYLVASKGAPDPLAVWREWASDVEGREIVSGHFLAEENPEATLAALLQFLDRTAEGCN
ncbi:MAG TPA: alpha/beta hydrolase [Hyphomicrobiaceae bacterium]|nr:alpha/beta hydrolase [Hyphomicrobiaceae bacterium]